MATRLEINGHIADIDGVISMPITRQFDDLLNPAAIKNSASKTIQLPATPTNNVIFANIWRIDQVNTGIFDASKRVNFVLSEDGMLIMSGYLKLSNIVKVGGLPRYYEINLYGEKGGFFYELSNKDLLDIPLPDDLRHRINRQSANNSVSPVYPLLIYMMAYTGRYENFESDKTYQGPEPTELDKEVDEHQRREYRSYYQIPALSLSEMISLIVSNSSYTVNLSDSFFKSSNPYWSRTYLSMPQYNAGEEKQRNYPSQLAADSSLFYVAENGMIEKNNDPKFISGNTNVWDIANQLIKFSTYELDNGSFVFEIDMIIRVYLGAPGSTVRRMKVVNADAPNSNNPLLDFKIYLQRTPGISVIEGESLIMRPSDLTFDYRFPAYSEVPIHYTIHLEYNRGEGSYYDFKIMDSLTKLIGNSRLAAMDIDTGETFPAQLFIGLGDNSISLYYDYLIRSNSVIDKYDIIPRGTSQMQLLTSYVKVFGLVIDSNDDLREINIMTRNEYFKDYKIIDWTDRIDYSKEVRITPLNFDYRFATMSWAEADTRHLTRYREKYNQPYGSMKLDTGYDFDNNNKELLDGVIFQNAVISSEYDPYFNGRTNIPYQDDKIIPALFNGNANDRSKADVQFSIFFHEGNRNVNRNFPIRYSDDSSYAPEIDLYRWVNQPFTEYTQTYYTQFSRRTELGGQIYSLDFGKPSEIYYPITEDEYPAESTIYNRFWRSFMSERLNSDTRVMTCYVWITKAEFAMWKFSNFVKIENTLWHVNKIIDYDNTRNQTTKVELVRVNDIDAYINGQNI